jgi:RNA polymerase sigma-70 factor (ECF subfamily)
MKKAYYIALSFVKREQDALDISQDAFIKAFRHIKKFKTGSAFFPWFYKILKNLCLDWLRKNKPNQKIPLENSNPVVASQPNIEICLQVWNGIEKLPLEQREILILRYFQGFSYKEIAQILGKPTGSIMSGLYYAKKNLRKKLENHK